MVELPKKHLAERYELLQDITETCLLKQGSTANGQTLKELDLRAKTGATIIAAQRKDKIYQNPPSNFALKTGDAVLLIGSYWKLFLAGDIHE
jgi:K+/H+ antiporter YhaU regulatory subunit KhtT